MNADSSVALLALWRAGDQQAATELFNRYSEQLLHLARRQLSSRLAARLDPEDVVQSACRSFFAGARADRYVLQQSGDLWYLLVAITLHKLHRQVRRHTAGKRSVEREESFSTASELARLAGESLAREPEPAEALAVVDELEYVLRDLKPLHRRMVELRLQGYQIDEVANATERSHRFVYRVLEKVKERLRQRYEEWAAW